MHGVQSSLPVHEDLPELLPTLVPDSIGGGRDPGTLAGPGILYKRNPTGPVELLPVAEAVGAHAHASGFYSS